MEPITDKCEIMVALAAVRYHCICADKGCVPHVARRLESGEPLDRFWIFTYAIEIAIARYRTRRA